MVSIIYPVFQMSLGIILESSFLVSKNCFIPFVFATLTSSSTCHFLFKHHSFSGFRLLVRVALVESFGKLGVLRLLYGSGSGLELAKTSPMVYSSIYNMTN